MNHLEITHRETTEKRASAFLILMLVVLAIGLALAGVLGHFDQKNRDAIEKIDINAENRPF